MILVNPIRLEGLDVLPGDGIERPRYRPQGLRDGHHHRTRGAVTAAADPHLPVDEVADDL